MRRNRTSGQHNFKYKAKKVLRKKEAAEHHLSIG